MAQELTPIQNSLKGNNLIGIANNTMRELPPIAVLDEDLYQYTVPGGYWDTLSDLEIGQHIYTLFADNFPSGWSPSKMKNIIEGVKYHPKVIKVKEFDTYKEKNLMNLKNGVLDLDNIEAGLLLHDQKYLFTSCIPVDYDPTNTKCPRFVKFLRDTFRNPDDTIDLEMCDTIIQLGGYLLYPQIRVKKLFVFYGNGANGKSILMDNVFSLFFNPNNVTDLSLNILANEDNTARGDLLRSRVNMCGEQKGGEIASDEIKKIVSGETISVKRHYKNSRKRFKPHTKILISGNERIYLKDSTYGADRRLFAIDFLNEFVSQQRYDRLAKEYAKAGKTPEQKRVYLAEDERVLAKAFKEEAPAILNLFLAGLQQLRNRRWKFKKHASILRAEIEYKEEADPVMLWLLSSYKESSTEFITFQQIYDDYIFWFNVTYAQSKRSPLSKIYISKKIKRYFKIDSISFKNQKGFNLKAR